MAKTTTEQYQPRSTAETSGDDALSVAFARDTGKSLNNYKHHAGIHKVFGGLWLPHVASLDDTNKNLILYLGRHWVPEGLRQVRWWITMRRTADVAGECTWTLGCSPDFYNAAEEFDSTSLGDYTSSDIVNDGAYSAWERKESTMTLSRADFNGYRWFYLIAENDTGGDDVANRTEMVALDIQPLVT